MKFESGRISLSPNPRENILEYDGVYYQIDFLTEEKKYVSGGNGTVFSLTNEEVGADFVVKFLKFPNELDGQYWKRIRRFEREIEAFGVVTSNSIQGIVPFEFFGEYAIDGYTFKYYVMQRCDCTLKEYMESNRDNLSFDQMTILCRKVLESIKTLHEYGLYHRDIKHTNIYFIGDEPLIGDLGLVDYQDTEYYINERGELIGPVGWFSPEAINKWMVEKTKLKLIHDCRIDSKSEVFQLGKLFWYIYQGNIPIGQIHVDDFLIDNEEIFYILFDMLEYSKARRASTREVAERLDDYLAA
jgi:serine/threonine protein kinase